MLLGDHRIGVASPPAALRSSSHRGMCPGPAWVRPKAGEVVSTGSALLVVVFTSPIRSRMHHALHRRWWLRECGDRRGRIICMSRRRAIGGEIGSSSDIHQIELFPTGWEEFKTIAGAEAEALSLDCKHVHFVRHAESVCNAAGAVYNKGDPRRKKVFEDPQHFDSPLSPQGFDQCARLKATTGVLPNVQLVAASPLTRALQTAFGIYACGKGEDVPLMVLEALREFNSSVFHPCDARRRREELELEFPDAYFSGVPEGGDMLLAPGLLETAEIVDNRIHWLLAWIRLRPERSIAVVSHGAFLRRLFTLHLEPAGWSIDSIPSGDRRFGNLEIRSVPIVFQ